jgi:hypothetical protein
MRNDLVRRPVLSLFPNLGGAAHFGPPVPAPRGLAAFLPHQFGGGMLRSRTPVGTQDLRPELRQPVSGPRSLGFAEDR